MKYRKTKFDETLLENQDWKNFQLDSDTKYAPCFIESPDIVSEDDRITMLVRCEEIFHSGSHGGNCDHFNYFCKNLMGVPEYPYNFDRYFIKHENYSELRYYCFEQYKKKSEEYNNLYNINPYQDVFKSYLITSCYFSPNSFIHKDGRIGMFHTIDLKWTAMEDISEEIEWFAKTYPQYKIFLTLCRGRYNDKEPTPLITLMLYNGEIKVVTTRTVKQMRYVLKMSYDKEYVLLWKEYKEPSKISEMLKIIKYKLIDLKDFVIEKLFPRYSYNRNCKNINNSYEAKSSRYFEDWEVRDIVERFRNIISITNKQSKSANDK